MRAKAALAFYLSSCALTLLVAGIRIDTISIVCMFALAGMAGYVVYWIVDHAYQQAEKRESENGGS